MTRITFFCFSCFLSFAILPLIFFDFYSSSSLASRLRKIAATGIALAISTLLLIVSMYLLHLQNVSRGLLLMVNILALVLLLARQYLSRYMMRASRQNGHRSINILIIGSRDRAKETIKHIYQEKDSLYNVVGCIETKKAQVGNHVVNGVKVIGDLEDLESILLHSVVDEIIFAIPLKKIENVQEYIAFAENLGVQVRIMPDWQLQRIMYRPETASISFETFAHLPTLALSSTPKKDLDLMVKGFVDYAGALIGLIGLSPLLLLIAVLIKITSPGPVFFIQQRSGLNGRLFPLYKFRTMVENAEELREDLLAANEMDGPVFKLTHDPRVTTIGRFLRKTSLDELPQLFNVVRGHMSLVGPRPPIPAEVEQYAPSQRRRLSMKPGMTCIWQVSGRNDIDFDNWMKLDLKYIDNWSLQLDLKLLAKTVMVVFAGTGH